MSKKVFWPAALVIMGLIFLAANMGMLPSSLWNLWPVILIVVGLGGLVTSDRDEWMVDPDSKPKKKAAPQKAAKKASAKPAASKMAAKSKKKAAPKKKK